MKGRQKRKGSDTWKGIQEDEGYMVDLYKRKVTDMVKFTVRR